MDPKKREALERKGWHVGGVQEFLGLTDAEMELVDMRERLAEAVRARRILRGLTQPAFAKILKTSQSRVSMIETAKPGVSMDQLVTALLATGASTADVGAAMAGGARPKSKRRESTKP